MVFEIRFPYPSHDDSWVELCQGVILKAGWTLVDGRGRPHSGRRLYIYGDPPEGLSAEDVAAQHAQIAERCHEVLKYVVEKRATNAIERVEEMMNASRELDEAVDGFATALKTGGAAIEKGAALVEAYEKLYSVGARVLPVLAAGARYLSW